MKLWDLIRSAHANLWRNKGRTILTIIAIFIGAFTIAITTGINTGVNDYIDRQLSGAGRDDQMMIMKKVDQGSTSDGPEVYQADSGTSGDAYLMGQADADKVADIPGIENSRPNQQFQADYIQSDNSDKYKVELQSGNGLTFDLKSGRQLSEDADDYEIILAQDYVEALGFDSAKDAIDAEVKIAASSQATQQQETVTATVVGVSNPSLISSASSIVNPALADELVSINQNGLPDQMKSQFYNILATIGDTSEEGISKVKDRLDDAGYTGQTFADQLGTIHAAIDGVTGVLTLFGAIALLAASFGIINTLYMSVQDRTREIGLMKAMGMGRGKVFLSFSIEAVLIGFWGSLVGILGAMLAAAIINPIATDSFLQGLDGLQLIQFSAPSVVMIMLVIMLIAFLAGTMPANRAAKLEPIEALRYE